MLHKTQKMNKIVILLIGISFFSCAQEINENKRSENKSTEITNNNANFDWLLGEWKRNNEEAGKETFENWKKISDTEYEGLGFTLQNGDTIFQEKIRLIGSDTNWNLIVQLKDASDAVTFKISSYNDNEFICENKENDFPNKIKYWKNVDNINAAVSGADMKISFEFERIQKDNK